MLMVQNTTNFKKKGTSLAKTGDAKGKVEYGPISCGIVGTKGRTSCKHLVLFLLSHMALEEESNKIRGFDELESGSSICYRHIFLAYYTSTITS